MGKRVVKAKRTAKKSPTKAKPRLSAEQKKRALAAKKAAATKAANRAREAREKAKRSKAAKVGWQRRKTNAKEREAAKPTYVRGQYALDLEPPPDDAPRPLTELQARVIELERLKGQTFGEATYAEHEFYKGFMRPDGTIAKNYSRLRWETSAATLQERLQKAAMMGEEEFEAVASRISDEFDCRLNEVYTLFWS